MIVMRDKDGLKLNCVILEPLASPKSNCFQIGFLNTSPVCHWSHSLTSSSRHWLRQCCYARPKHTVQCFDSTTKSQCLHFLRKNKPPKGLKLSLQGMGESILALIEKLYISASVEKLLSIVYCMFL